MKNTWSLQTRYLVLIIFVLLLVALSYYARALIGPLLVSALLAYVMEPAVTILVRRYRVQRKLAVPLVYVGLLIVLVAIPAIFTPVVIDQGKNIGLELGRIQQILVNSGLTSFLSPGEDLSEPLQDFFAPLMNPERVFGVLQMATANLAWVLIILVTTYYFLLDWERLRNWFIDLIPSQYHPDINHLMREVNEVWKAYLRGQLLLMLIVGTLTWLGGAALGLPAALLIGMLAGLLDVIPSVGPVVAMFIAVVIALLEGSTYLPLSNVWFAALVLGVFTAIQVFENIYLRPRIFSQTMRIHPGVVFVAIVSALALAGILIALVIVPTIRTAEIVGRYTIRRIWGLQPWERVTADTSTDEQPLATGGTNEMEATKFDGTLKDIRG